MISRHILATTFFLAAVGILSAADNKQPDCVYANASPPEAALSPDSNRTVKITFFNACGKDVTAVAFRFEAPGVKPFTSTVDWISALGDQNPDHYINLEGEMLRPDILRAGKSLPLRHWVLGDAPFYTVVVTCALFTDHTATGDHAAIMGIQGFRPILLAAAEENVEILRKLSALEYKEAKAQLTEGRIKARQSSAPYLSELRGLSASRDEKSWQARVQQMIGVNKKLVEVLKEALASEYEEK
jgi:hypothetical protein